MAVVSNPNEGTVNTGEPIRLNSYAETLICSICDKAYISRGKHDPGYCRDCERTTVNEDTVFIGGPLHGQRVGDTE